MSKRSAEGDPGEPGSEPPSKRMPGGEGGKDLQFLVSEVLYIPLCHNIIIDSSFFTYRRKSIFAKVDL